MRNIKYNDAKLSFIIDKNLYSETVVYKCFYWYLNDYEFDINPSESFYQITLINKTLMKFDEEELICRIKNDLADFKLREIINYETQNIKELIIAKALSNYEEEYTISTDVSDPIGFDPKSF
ncbi:His-Xaa-Ser system protein HxsD [Chryseobacterium vrystaatense]|uniref:His-Xaa-Ser system protein HxsD n=1 Tax=Chryseobacterium vrystaatense TaxID=307480 RepID=UPI00068F76DA|nr:His-Xaa-Ser system protein HxsD [Chryseobacterium vrystaatense]